MLTGVCLLQRALHRLQEAPGGETEAGPKSHRYEAGSQDPRSMGRLAQAGSQPQWSVAPHSRFQARLPHEQCQNGGAECGEGAGSHHEFCSAGSRHEFCSAHWEQATSGALCFLSGRNAGQEGQPKDHADVSLSHLAAAPPAPTRSPNGSKQRVEKCNLGTMTGGP